MRTPAIIAISAWLAIGASALAAAEPLGTVFHYQGRLGESTAVAHGLYDLRFTLHDSGDAGSVLAGPSTNARVAVNQGLFTVSLDFHAAFAVGADDRHIATVDADGVALAAIQGLHEMVKAKDAEIQELKGSVAELKTVVRQLLERSQKPSLSGLSPNGTTNGH
jgi:hypothetical protein